MDLVLVLSVFGTALLSGVFGMAGGLLLLLVLSLRMPLPEAMVLHGAAQLIANGARAALSARHIRVDALAGYFLAAALTFLLCMLTEPVLTTTLALLVTGALPFVSPLLIRAHVPTMDKPLGAMTCGALVTGAHLTAGVSGPLLDLFFLEAPFKRQEVVATKAATQCLGHLLKIVYFGALAVTLPVQSPTGWLVLFGASLGGTLLGKLALDRMDDTLFRKASGTLIRAIGLACIVRALVIG